MAQVLTANRLIDGDVVYWRHGRWVEALGEAEVFADEAAAKPALDAAQAFVNGNVVVNPYLFELRDGRPIKEREIIRAMGPSVRADVGKQATGIHPPPGALRVPTSPSGFAPAELRRDKQGGGEREDDDYRI